MSSKTHPEKPLNTQPINGKIGSGQPAGATHITGQALLSLRHAYAVLTIETPALWSGMDRLIKRLEASGQSLERNLSKVTGQSGNQDVLAHIIGIERWGQRHLCVALGEPLCDDRYDFFRQDNQNWPQLVEAFHAARKETISLGKSLRMAGIDPKTRIPHHQFGDISLLGWLYYLNMHALLESIRIH